MSVVCIHYILWRTDIKICFLFKIPPKIQACLLANVCQWIFFGLANLKNHSHFASVRALISSPASKQHSLVLMKTILTSAMKFTVLYEQLTKFRQPWHISVAYTHVLEYSISLPILVYRTSRFIDTLYSVQLMSNRQTDNGVNTVIMGIPVFRPSMSLM